MSVFKKWVLALREADLELVALAAGPVETAEARLQRATELRVSVDSGGGLALPAVGFQRRLEDVDEVLEPVYAASLNELRRSADEARDLDDEEARLAAQSSLELLEAQPITVSKPRYGEKMRSEVRSALAQLESVLASAVELCGLLEVEVAGHEEHRLSQLARDLTRLAETVEKAEADAVAASNAAKEARLYLDGLAERRRVELAALHSEAELKRQERLVRRENMLRALRDEELRVRETGRGSTALDAALLLLSASSEHYDTALSTLDRILGAIIDRPDDSKIRNIRCAHPKFQSDLDSHDGGRKALVAAGFDLTHRENPSSKDEEDWATFEAFLVCREPPPSLDNDDWSDWFNNLKTCHARVTEELKRRGALRRTGLLTGNAPHWAANSK